ncbi:DUF3048 domain-containing protein [Caldibacillus lycopersici]|uniref:DUF3048 domain-containing protein n=2 Tax=Perspicuibacillus lycopersici TaxID=1325689 RepID=A0AAE3ITE7_9BACI|nr:DUF3048 domain-containing protein [Perspicuibacillus lycopersici]
MLLMVGCSKNQEEKQDVEDNEGRDIEVVEKETPSPYTYPLTGIATDEESTDRAISVMINNHPAARPQSGLYKADVIYEILAEGGVTRFLAVFQSEKPEIVGPVRSSRDYYIQLAKGLDSFYVFHGWSPEAKVLINEGFIDSLNGLTYDGILFKRASFRKAPHNSYITYENIVKGAEENGISLSGAPTAYTFLKEEDEVPGTEVSSVSIDYSTDDFFVEYKYDSSAENYMRYSADQQTVDYDTGEPVLVNNIFIVEMEHAVVDEKGRRDIDITSGGKALLLQKGKMQEVEWRNIDGRIVPYANGAEVSLVPGKTWINVVPSLNQVSY